MSDRITKIINRLRAAERESDEGEMYDPGQVLADALELADEIDRRPTAPAQGDRWIRCAERMPEPNLCVVGTNGKGVVLVAWHKFMGSGGGFAKAKHGRRTTTLEHVEGITHWHPIPEPLPTAPAQGGVEVGT